MSRAPTKINNISLQATQLQTSTAVNWLINNSATVTSDGVVGGGILPVVDGSIPPVFLQNSDGSLIYAPITES